MLIAAGVVAVFCCARLQDEQMGTQSDGASMVLEAWAMSHGNLLLHGWYLADVTFYTTELPEYMLVEVFRGLRPDVVNICSALTYTLIVVLAAAVAYGIAGRAGKRAGLAGAVIAVAVLLGPLPAATNVLINDPDHVGSAIPVLLAFLLASRVLDGRTRSAIRSWALSVAVAAVLAWAMVGDPLVEVAGIAPLVLVCGCSALWWLVAWRRRTEKVAPALSLTVAGLVAVAAGTALTRLIPRLGGFQTDLRLNNQVLPLGTVIHDVPGVMQDFFLLFSVSFAHPGANGWLAVTVVHVIFACLVLAALLLVLLRVFRGDDLVARLLAAGIVANLTAYALFYHPLPVTAREIGPVFGLGGALAGRVLGERVTRRRLDWTIPVTAVAAMAVLVPPLLTVVPVAPATGDLAAFLTSHHLQSGLAGYWQANSVTVETGGRVTVLPVHAQTGTILAPLEVELDSSKLSVPGHQANFVVTTSLGDAGVAGAGGGVTEEQAVKEFGEPAYSYQVGRYTISVWQENLLPRLTAPILKYRLRCGHGRCPQ